MGTVTPNRRRPGIAVSTTAKAISVKTVVAIADVLKVTRFSCRFRGGAGK